MKQHRVGGECSPVFPVASVAVAVDDAPLREHVRTALRGTATVYHVAALQLLDASRRTDAVVVEFDPRRAPWLHDALLALRRREPWVAVVLLGRPMPGLAEAMIRSAAAGGFAVALYGFDDCADVVRSAIAHHPERDARGRLCARIAERSPRAIACVLDAYIRDIRRQSVDGVAHALGVSRRTLCHQFAVARWPVPA